MNTEEKKGITVEELIKEVENSNKLRREYDFSKHLKRSYMPYNEKCGLARSVVESTSYEEVNGIQVYKRSTNAMLFIFTMKLIEQYTNIEINVSEITKDYDALMETGIMNSLMSQIPAEEVSILRGMVDMERDDLECNTRSLISFFESKADAIKIVMNGLSNVFENPEVQAKIAELAK